MSAGYVSIVQNTKLTKINNSKTYLDFPIGNDFLALDVLYIKLAERCAPS